MHVSRALLLAALTACTAQQRVGVLAAGAMALTACDYRQTAALSDGGRWDVRSPSGGHYVELNPFLGGEPSTAAMMVYTAAGEASLVAVAASRLPTWVKYTVLGAALAVEAIEVARISPAAGICGGRR